MRNKFWKNINFNKWHQDMPDCQIRSICAAIGFDYEVACEKLNVKYIPNKGFNDTYGVDLDVIYSKFKKYLGQIHDMLDNFDDPVQALTNGISLNTWLEEHQNDNKTYLIYLDDNKVMDGGHIVAAQCYGQKTFFIDTFDCGQMFVQEYIEVKKQISKTSKLHWKFDRKLNIFI